MGLLALSPVHRGGGIGVGLTTGRAVLRTGRRAMQQLYSPLDTALERKWLERFAKALEQVTPTDRESQINIVLLLVRQSKTSHSLPPEVKESVAQFFKERPLLGKRLFSEVVSAFSVEMGKAGIGPIPTSLELSLYPDFFHEPGAVDLFLAAIQGLGDLHYGPPLKKPIPAEAKSPSWFKRALQWFYTPATPPAAPATSPPR